MATIDLTAQRLRELLHYDSDTGAFTWRQSFPNAAFGTRAGSVESHGYRRIRIDKRRYREHRLVWLYVTGSWPKNEIDHINGVKTDNRITNLRDVDRTANIQNHRRSKGTRPSGSKWAAQITMNKKTIYLGTFACEREARDAYIAAKLALHPGYVG